jgi:hypothetical protein
MSALLVRQSGSGIDVAGFTWEAIPAGCPIEGSVLRDVYAFQIDVSKGMGIDPERANIPGGQEPEGDFILAVAPALSMPYRSPVPH